MPTCVTTDFYSLSYQEKIMRKGVAACAAILILASAGCHSASPKVLSIPSTRDYQELPTVAVPAAVQSVAKARSAGAEHSAPYEYFSAEEYLRMAQRTKGDASRDYAALAQQMAEAALRKGPVNEHATSVPPLGDEAAVRSAFNDLTARLHDLDKDKAIAVAPVLYARATSGLSRAEFLLSERRGWKEAAGILPGVSSDLDTIVWQDSDGDKIPDIKDAAPQLPEDMDGFEDEDGAPDPDNDRDGIPDVVDKQPSVAETRNRWHDDDGAADDYPKLEPVYFPEGSTALSPDARGYLQGIKLLLDEWTDLKLHIKGYSDNLHSDTYSMDLSQRRAQEVQRYLMLLGTTGDRLVSTYHGQADATDPNAANRVELSFE
jgi:outer membrane protein OmpA-like peptidoglycan-associated protein